jgi:hypothetical protein
MARHTVSCALVLMASAFAQDGPSKLNAREQATALGAIREYAMNYTKKLPNYTCTQVTTTRGTQTDLIEEELSVVDHREVRKVTKINGKPAPKADPSQLSRPSSHGEFGNLLEVLFDPETRTDFRWDRFATLNGRRMYVFAFRVAQPEGYAIEEPKRIIRVAYRGLLYADYQTKAVLRIELECIKFPADSTYQAVEFTLDYQPTQVAGQEFTLPSHYQLHARRVFGETTIDIDYKSYRRFGAEATIVFDDSTQ